MGNEPVGEGAREAGSGLPGEPPSKEGERGVGDRRPWQGPRITCYGSTRWLIRGASGPLGDKTTAVGKRT
jgi:hypothetical protein